jgi:two-component system response regulator FlrC
MKPLPILIAEDDDDLREALRATLELHGYRVLEAVDGESALDLLRRERVGLVVSDVQMQPMDGHALLAAVKREYPHMPVVLMTAYGMIDRAVSAIRAGAANYLSKPFEPERLLEEVTCHLLPAYPPGDDDLIAEDPATRRVVDLARRVAPTDATVLITGESGTGKEVFARFIHRQSPRAARPFVAINCAAIPENLLEATLFGYEKGAYTGATQAQAGKFEQAQGGTLLLDEISEMPLGLQAKLLRVLQEREVERVGGKSPIGLDIRVIATSNRDMPAEVREGRFREDLYYRINVFPLDLPPLRARPLDIVALARNVLRRSSARPVRLAPDAEEKLTTHIWLGNIRELENLLQRALILTNGDVVSGADLHLGTAAIPAAVAAAGPGLRQSLPALAGTDTDIKAVERNHILATLASVKGSRKEAALKMGMSERTLRYKLAQYRAEGLIGGES